ncbi:carbohydrate-binding family 9-like protein [Fulvivirga sediminis]|uniref:carbohydrate-binding family 9-like protein n=1 Tax=Fulvivirga sediminis TaxID=2803949 RepID=UPI001F31234A|nr:carbohydrate-binding family 9-like protein [Fulvivirga sediminis]
MIFFSSAHAQHQNLPHVYNAQYTSESLAIDGKSEPAWDKAPWTSSFIDIEGVEKPTYNTKVKMLWDDEYLYFYAELEEPHVWADITQRDEVIFYNNDFEIFINPDGDTHNYLEFEMNALNTVWDLWLAKPYRNDSKVIDNWDIKGLKTAVDIKGTLNDPADIDLGWSIEIAMPWSALGEASKNLKAPEDKVWRINFSRVNWDYSLDDGKYGRKKDENGNYFPEYNWVWSPQYAIDMHRPELWGYVYFTKKKNTNYTLTASDEVVWKLYQVYRSIIERNDVMVFQKQIKVEGRSLPITLEEHSAGWNLKVDDPFSGKAIIIREDGLLIYK